MYKISTQSIYNRWVIVTLLITVSIVLGLSYKIHTDNKVRINQAVFETSKTLKQEVLTRIQLYQYGLRGARGAVLTTGENEISRNIFTLYSLTRDVDDEFPGARGFGFIRRVPQSEEDAFVESARQDGWPDFSIKTLAPNFNERYVIQYIEPVDRNRQAVGLDIASEKNRREAAASSLYTGEVRLTGPITLVQASGKPQQSFLILMPIYRGGSTPLTQAERIQKGFGWSYAPLLMEEVLNGLPIDPEQIHYELVDITDLDNPVLFYDSGTSGIKQFKKEQTTLVYGRHWQSSLSITPAFIEALRLPDPITFLVVGLLISGLLTIIVMAIRLNIVRRREVMAHQARITAVVESSADGIISKNLDGIIVSWNQGAERIFGFTKEEAIGHDVNELLVPQDLKHEEATIITKVKKDKSSHSIETRRRTKYGTEIPVSLTLSPILDVNNNVFGVSNTVRDISERKKAEARIFELNTNLENQVKARTAEIQELNLMLNDVLSASSEVSIIATDLNGVIKLFNKGAERMLGYSAEEVVGRMTPLGFHDVTEIEQHRREILNATGVTVVESLGVLVYRALQGDFESKEWTYLHKDGSTRPVSLVVTTMKDSSNEIIGYLGMAMDITEQKNNQQALIYAHDQLLMAAEVAQLGIWNWDIEGNTLEWNDLMLDIYQYPLSKRKDGIVYEDWLSRLHPDDREMAAEALKNAVDGTGYYDMVFRIILPNNKIRYISASASLQENPEGNKTIMMGVNRDVTAERELESWLRKAKEEAISASVAKSSFLANMSHEIRTPMNAILGMLHLVKRTALSSQQEDYISKAQISAKTLLGLINDVLDFTKVDAGKLELEKAPFEVEALLSELATVLSGSTMGKKVELIFDIDKDIPTYLVGDKLRFLQILINLLSNAMKFTLEGCVVLEIKQLSMESTVSRLKISVKDTGIGISADKLESIFDVFSQAESSTARRFGGSGLGLVICRRFVELMGGNLQVESEPEKGSTFYFTVDFPVADVEVEKPSDVINAPIRLLIIDSNDTSKMIFSRMAMSLGWSSETADSVRLAGPLVSDASAAGQPFDAVLLDCKTSDFAGAESIKQIESAIVVAEQRPKVLLMSNALDDQLDALTECVSGRLIKPVTLSKLSETVYESLTGEIRHRFSLQDTTDLSDSLLGITLLLVEDNAFNRQVATELLMSQGAKVEVADGGLEGVNAVLSHDVGTFDVVLMDMQMPGVDGLEATKRIRKEARFADLPIIAMTANVSQADKQSCFQAGMIDHIAKPLDIDQMTRCILRYAKRAEETVSSSKDEHTPRRESDDHNSDVVEHEDLQSILSRFAGSADLYKNVVEGFRVEADDLLAHIAQGVNQRDVTHLIESLHTLKGAALTMGLPRLSGKLAGYEATLKSTDSDEVAVEKCLASIETSNLREMLDAELTVIINDLNSLP